MSWDGLCAIVTGSASGLGAATASILAKGGVRVVINYSSSRKEAEQTADLCRSAGAEVVAVQGDVSRDEDCRRIVAAAAPWGRLDALVNNAGTTKHVPHDNLDGLSAEDFQRLFAVNTIGPFQMVRAARSLLEAGAKASGRASSVVNVSSVAGISGIGSSVAYAASKGALNTITLSLARALAPLIRVNAVCPGYIDTPWFTKGRGVEGEQLSSHSGIVLSIRVRSLHSGPGMRAYLLPGSEITLAATSLFQMNRTTSAPMVAVMKPAP
jgi:NAD(P)-dependent dehydrogenase (short-subunit alcohol dehydrogenase family)